MKVLFEKMFFAVGNAFGFFREIEEGADERFYRAMIKKLRRAVDNGEKYILTNEDADIDPNEKERKLKRYKNSFFKNNN